MRWVTREHPKTDRIACPCLIRKFIDPSAEIVYVPKGEVLAYAEREGAKARPVSTRRGPDTRTAMASARSRS